MSRLELLSISKYRYPVSWAQLLKDHTHDFFQIFVGLSGEGEIRVDQTPVPIRENDCIIIAPDRKHTAVTVRSEFLLVIDIKVNILDEELFADFIRLPVRHNLAGERIQLAEQAWDRWKSDQERARQIALLLMEAFLLSLQEGEEKPLTKLPPIIKEDADGLVRQVSDYVEVRYVEGMTLDQLADDLGYNKTYLCTAFRQKTGKSIMAYMNYVRVQHAAELVCNTNLTLSEICGMTGFKNLSHFGNVFKKIAGISPGQLRRMDARREQQELNAQEVFLETNRDKYF